MSGARTALALVLAPVMALAPAPVMAQDALRFDPGLIESCLADEGGNDCIGVAAHACVADTPGGNSNAGMIDCFSREADWWEAAMEEAFEALLESEKLGDEWAASQPDGASRPSGVQTIRDVQRAWADWRDASCIYERLEWWRGSAERLVGAFCRLQMTGEQTLRLRLYLASGGG